MLLNIRKDAVCLVAVPFGSTRTQHVFSLDCCIESVGHETSSEFSAALRMSKIPVTIVILSRHLVDN